MASHGRARMGGCKTPRRGRCAPTEGVLRDPPGGGRNAGSTGDTLTFAVVTEQKVAPRLERALAIDVGLVLVAAAAPIALYSHGLGGSTGAVRHLDALGVVLAIAASVPLLAWRRAPAAAFG